MTKQLRKDNRSFYLYELKNDVFLKDGHLLFATDVLSDLQRKSFLEERLIEMESTITQLQEQLKQAEVKAIARMLEQSFEPIKRPSDEMTYLAGVNDLMYFYCEYLSKLKGEQE